MKTAERKTLIRSSAGGEVHVIKAHRGDRLANLEAIADDIQRKIIPAIRQGKDLAGQLHLLDRYAEQLHIIKRDLARK